MYESSNRRHQDYPPLGRSEVACALAFRLQDQGISYYDIHREVIFRDLTQERSKENPKLMDYSSRVLHEIEDFMVSHDMVKTDSLDKILDTMDLKQMAQLSERSQEQGKALSQEWERG